jgi:hypothetical protein
VVNFFQKCNICSMATSTTAPTLSPEMIRAIQERDMLVQECQGLLWQVARRPGCIKLLMGVRHGCDA